MRNMAGGWNSYGLSSSGFQTGSGGPPSLLQNGYRVSFPVVKRPECKVNHSPPSRGEVKNERRYSSICACKTFYLYLYPA